MLSWFNSNLYGSIAIFDDATLKQLVFEAIALESLDAFKKFFAQHQEQAGNEQGS
jgi:hypothetical protein